MKKDSRLIPIRVRETIYLLWFGFLKIPLLFYVRPRVVELSPEKVVIKIPLRRRTRNHLRSMYFGAMAVGADCAVGMIAMKWIREREPRMSLIFKNFSGEFMKRAEGDVYFTCTQGLEISGLVARAVETGERVEMPVEAIATVPSLSGDEPVARFILTLSLKKTET
jgi:acyl-coenzyme A thioesterase PaaI-like protein